MFGDTIISPFLCSVNSFCPRFFPTGLHVETVELFLYILCICIYSLSAVSRQMPRGGRGGRGPALRASPPILSAGRRPGPRARPRMAPSCSRGARPPRPGPSPWAAGPRSGSRPAGVSPFPGLARSFLNRSCSGPPTGISTKSPQILNKSGPLPRFDQNSDFV